MTDRCTGYYEISPGKYGAVIRVPTAKAYDQYIWPKPFKTAKAAKQFAKKAGTLQGWDKV